ncbi:MAG: tetratricopeptide repeat protein [Phycisphaeraceae bacterium]|nr:tetratricopeptide repeat protein [Phycisphaeraceae bacterium]
MHPTASNWNRPRPWLMALVLLVITLPAYLPVLRAGYIWDDDAYVTNNLTLRSAEGLSRIWLEPTSIPQYYPLVHTTFWLEYHLWGLHPLGYHLTNLLLHVLGATLLGLLLLRLGLGRGALLAAAIFALHPVEVESVAWITERKNVLAAVFYLASALVYLRFNPLTGDALPSGRWRHYAWATLLFAAALLSKTTVATLPAAILVVIWWKRGRLAWRDLWPMLPWFVMGVSMGLVTAWLERHHVGVAWLPEDFNLTFYQRVLIAGRAVAFYLGKLVWPADLIFIYPRWSPDASDPLQWLFPAAVLGTLVALLLLRRRIGRGPATAALLYVGTLLPALGFFDVYPFRYSFVADHFQHLASLAPIALAGAGLAWLTRQRAPRWLAAIAVALLLATLGTLTWRQTLMYRDRETLWRTTALRNPAAWIAQINLASELLDQRRIEEALPRLQTGLALRPNDPKAQNLLANARWRLGQREQAVMLLQGIIDRRQDNPQTHALLAIMLTELGRPQEALPHARFAAEFAPDDADVQRSLGLVYLALNQPGPARDALARAARLDPDDFRNHDQLALALLRLRQLDGPDGAIAALEHARTLNPDDVDVHRYLGVAQVTVGRLDEGIASLTRAAELAPRSPTIRLALAEALALAGRIDEALDQARQAISLARQADRPELVERIEQMMRQWRRPTATQDPSK